MNTRRLFRLGITTAMALFGSGCGFNPAELVFPVLEPNPFDSPPVADGPFAVAESRVEVDNLGDGAPGGITVFKPTTGTPRGTLVWVLGLNNRAYYHQSLQEHLASQGWLVLVPDTRSFSFTDFSYHRKIVDIAKHTHERAASGFQGGPGAMIALGGYSAGGSLAAFAAGELRSGDALAMWAPADAPFWYGVDPESLLPKVTAPSLFVLGQLDPVAPPFGWPSTMQSLMAASAQTLEVVVNGVHLFFQEPNDVDDRNPFTPLTRAQQMGVAIELTLDFLEARRGELTAGE